ncbi:MAG: hypothetical protein M8354_03015 [Halalkalicoccus sp.]|nr:hypothetical protein [Halalkalicoccus sp.]
MSTDTPTRTVASAVAWTTDLFRRTGVAIRGALSRRDGLAVLVMTTILYMLLYMLGLGHLGRGDGSFELFVVSDPLGRAFTQIAPFQFETVAFVALGPVEFLVAPVNALLGLALAVLVGINLAVSWVAWRGPTACRIGPGAGAAAGIPGLLSGFVCCGPTILLVVGLQASAGLIAAFQWLVPAAVLMLLTTLLWVGSRVESR